MGQGLVPLEPCEPNTFAWCVRLWLWFVQPVAAGEQAIQQAFRGAPELASCTYLRRDVAQEALPGLPQWLQKRGRTLTTFVSDCGSPRTEAALSALTSSALGLSTFIIHEASDYGLSILSTFTSLTRCELAGADSDLNLGALQTLAGLTALHLRDGGFSSLDQLASLIELRLFSGDIVSTRECMFTSSLCSYKVWGVVQLQSNLCLACDHRKIVTQP